MEADLWAWLESLYQWSKSTPRHIHCCQNCHTFYLWDMAMLTRYGHPAGLFWILTQPAHTVTIMQPIVPFQRLYLTPLISSGSEFTVQLFKESMNNDFLDFFVLFCLHLLFLDILAPYTYWPFNLWKITFSFELNSGPVSCSTTFVHLSSGRHLRQRVYAWFPVSVLSGRKFQ